MYFVIFKKNNEFILFSNQVFGSEEDALHFAKRSFKRKDVWEVVPYNSENYDKYWNTNY
jgi:hypothetical protein